jgi:hypothetical protein
VAARKVGEVAGKSGANQAPARAAEKEAEDKALPDRLTKQTFQLQRQT